MTRFQFQLLSMPHSHHPAGVPVKPSTQINQDLHLVHTLRGSGVLRVGGAAYISTPQCVQAAPMGQECIWDKRGRGAWEMINLHYRVTLADGSPLHERLELPIVFEPRGLPLIHRQLHRWLAQWTAGDPAAQLAVAAQVQALVARYWSEHGRQVTSIAARDDAMEQVRRLIDHAAGKPFDAMQLARHTGLSVSQLNRRFHAFAGVSPKVCWQQQRAGLCQRALRERSEPLEQLAMQLGFTDVYYFCRWFKHQTGVSPGEYRRQSRSVAI